MYRPSKCAKVNFAHTKIEKMISRNPYALLELELETNGRDMRILALSKGNDEYEGGRVHKKERRARNM